MRRTVLRRGLYGLSGSVIAVSVLIIYFGDLAGIIPVSAQTRSVVMFWGFFSAGLLGCCSIMLVIRGIVQAPSKGPQVRLAPALVLLTVAIALFCCLIYRSFKMDSPPLLRPGEIITI